MENRDMLQEQRYAMRSFANPHRHGAGSVGEMLGLEGHVGSAPPTGPGGSEGNG